MLLTAACPLCGRRGGPVCAPCLAVVGPPAALPPPRELDELVALLDYHAARPLVTGLKNGQRRLVLGPLADALAERLAPAPGAVVTWAPTTPARRRHRGFDQAELLARALARRWGLPCRRLLLRTAGAQSGRGRAARRQGPRFLAPGVVGAPVVLVDDVVTTGATLTAAARALRAAGAPAVTAAAIARAERPIA